MRFNTLVVLFAAVILFAVGNAQVTSVLSVITGAPSRVSSAVHHSSTTNSVSSLASSAISSSAATSSATTSGTTTTTSGTSSGTPASSAAASTDVSQTVVLQLAGLLTIFAVSFGMMLA